MSDFEVVPPEKAKAVRLIEQAIDLQRFVDGAEVYASAFGREAPNADDVLGALRDELDAVSPRG